MALSAWLFPFSGTQPMSFWSTSLPFLYGVFVLLLVPKDWRTVRTAAAVYALGTLLTWLIDSQIGSNVSRLPMLFAGVVLLAALPFTRPRSRKWYALVIVFAGLNFWIGFKAVDDMVRTAPTASWNRELAPLVNRLQQVNAERGRVEVVPASSHREASALAPYVNLARGWNRQADMKRNPLFYDDDKTLTSAGYRAWLDRWAVHYVVLPKGSPDESGARQEAELVREGQPYLTRIWGDGNWQLFAVKDPMPLADPPATVDHAGAGDLTIQVKTAGRVLIRVPYSPWLSLVDEDGKKVEGPRRRRRRSCARTGRRASPIRTAASSRWSRTRRATSGPNCSRPVPVSTGWRLRTGFSAAPRAPMNFGSTLTRVNTYRALAC